MIDLLLGMTIVLIGIGSRNRNRNRNVLQKCASDRLGGVGRREKDGPKPLLAVPVRIVFTLLGCKCRLRIVKAKTRKRLAATSPESFCDGVRMDATSLQKSFKVSTKSK